MQTSGIQFKRINKVVHLTYDNYGMAISLRATLGEGEAPVEKFAN
jgi:hypothetical protein